MPGFNKIIDGNFEITCSPTGIRKILRFIPYYDGSSINLDLNIRNQSDETRNISYRWYLWRWDGGKEYLIDCLVDAIKLTCKPGNNRRDIQLPYLAIPDKHYVKFSFFAGLETMKPEPLLMDFKLLPRDQYVPNIIMWIMGPILGAVFTLLVQLILQAIGK